MSNPCRSSGIGPFCSVPEKGDGEQYDCLETEIRRCLSELNLCIGLAKQPQFSTDAAGVFWSGWQVLPASSLPRRFSDISDCFRTADCDFRKCYCTEWECTSCLGTRNGLGLFAEPEPPEFDDSGFSSDYDPNSIVAGPGITKLTVSSSSYDRVIERVYGTHFVSGNVFWSSTPRQVNDVNISRLGGTLSASTDTRTVVDFAIGLCEGQIADVGRIWANEELIYDNTFDETTDLYASARFNGAASNIDPTSPFNTEFGEFFIFDGREDQVTPPEMAIDGDASGQPGYRGLAYLLFKNFDVTTLNGAIPTIRVEVVRTLSATSPVLESSIVQDTASTLGGGSAEVLSIKPESEEILWPGLGSTASVSRPGLRYINSNTLEETRDVVPVVNFDASAATYLIDSFTRISNQYVLAQDAGLETYVVRTLSAAQLGSTSGIPAIGAGSRVDVMRVSATASEYVATLIDDVNLNFFVVNLSTGTLSTLASFPALMGRTIAKTIKTTEYSNIDTAVPRVIDYMYAFAISTAGTSIDVKRFTLNDSEGVSFFDTTETPDSFTIPASVFGGASAFATIKDVVRFSSNDGFLITVESSGQTFMFMWNPTSGAVWSADVQGQSFYNRFDSAYDYPTSTYSWIAADDNIYSVNLATGLVTLTGRTADDIAGVQFFNPLEGSITYVSGTTTAKLSKTFTTHNAKAAQPLDAVVADMLETVGLEVDEYDVSALSILSTDGYKANSTANLTATLKQLDKIYSLIFTEQGGRIIAQPRAAGSITVIDEDKYGTAKPVEVEYEEKFTQLLNVSLTYNSREQEYNDATQHVRKTQFLRDTELLENVVNTSFAWPVVLSDDEARRFCERILFDDDIIPRTAKFSLGPKDAFLTPGDLVQLEFDGLQLIMEIVSIVENAELHRDVITREIRPEVYLESASIAGVEDSSSLYNAPTIPVPRAVEPIVFEVPPPQPLRLADVGGFNAIMMTGIDDGSGTFSPYDVYYEDGDGRLKNAGTITTRTQIGRLVTPPIATHSRFATDRTSAMVVEFSNTEIADKLSSATNEELLADFERNVLFVGREIIQFQDFSIAPDMKTVTFTNLLRGLRHTDDVVDQHLPSELVGYYEPTSVIRTVVPLSKEPDSVFPFGAVPSGDTADASALIPTPISNWNRRAPGPPEVRRSGGTESFPYVQLFIMHRELIYHDLTDDDRYLFTAFNQARSFCAVLASEFDPDLFQAHVGQLVDLDESLLELIPPDTSYIKRFIKMKLDIENADEFDTDEAFMGWVLDPLYDPDQQLADGVNAFTGEFHIAVFTADNIFDKDRAPFDNDKLPDGYNAIGRVHGYRSEGQQPPLLTDNFGIGIQMRPILDSTNGL